MPSVPTKTKTLKQGHEIPISNTIKTEKHENEILVTNTTVENVSKNLSDVTCKDILF